MPASAPSPSSFPRTSHPRFARAFARAVPAMDRAGGAEHRRELLSRARGAVVEVGSGTGANFASYPHAATNVIALEPDPYLRGLSAEAAERSPVAVEVRDGIAESLPLVDDSADTVVASLVLCSVSDQEAALAEIRRVLRPGGLLLFYEHVRSENRLIALAEDAVVPLWRRLAGNCHLNRDTLRVIERAGFRILDARRFGFSPGPGPGLAHILGAATPRA
ncbi:class I SAM-dependent methyltransferase [Naasia sp. SYSU D00057]|uniref:class I SAM-dependent methyltransferase n=1 Tax=Naasia sp. SYSU D00057 TaxID=2817380 RepID=UPI001B31198D|nr:class I SAM-dependent methyltransferase [Naasia sp. SYSU D00057]